MLSLSQILKATPKAVKKRASDQCYAKPWKKKSTPGSTDGDYGGTLVDDPTGQYREFKRIVRCTDGPRRTVVRFHGPLNMNTPVWCSCSCPYFLFKSEVALTRKGSSSIIYSNGRIPKVTNPTMRPMICKHLVLAFALALRRKVPSKEIFAKSTTPQYRDKVVMKREVWAGDNTISDREPTVVGLSDSPFARGGGG